MEVPLGGKYKGVALVSKEDFDRVSKYKWRNSNNDYITADVEGKTVRLHHFITNSNPNQIVDHINGNGLDNQRCNLRTSDEKKNGQNKRKMKRPTSSKYRGVYKTKYGRYKAYMGIDGKRHNLGTYKTENEAAQAIDLFVIFKKLDHIQLNFPEKREEYSSMEYKPHQPKEPTNEYIGVKKQEDKYIAGLRINKKYRVIGDSTDPVAAAKLYDAYVVKHNLVPRKINFPEEHPTYNTKAVLTKCEKIDDNIVKLLLNYKDSNKIATIDKSDYDKIKYIIVVT